VTFFVLLGAMFGYLLPEILSSTSTGSPTFGEQAYGQVGPAQATDLGSFECGAMDCAGGEISLPRSIALKPAGQCKIAGSCVGGSVELDLATVSASSRDTLSDRTLRRP
jgi:hypothetical protein